MHKFSLNLPYKVNMKEAIKTDYLHILTEEGRFNTVQAVVKLEG
jgi:hypothetical protein